MPQHDPEAAAEAVFAALAEPTRRSILTALAARGPMTATGLAGPLPISRQAISKHLELLAASGLVLAEPGERRRIRYRVHAAPMTIAQSCLAALARDWDSQLARLQRSLEPPAPPARGQCPRPGSAGGMKIRTLREDVMTIEDKAVLVTGANRGIGQALVEEALRRGAKRVYAGTRQPLAHPDGRVTPLTLDVTSAAQTQAAAGKVGSLDLLINNAGLALYDDLSDRGALEQSLAVNLFGTYGVIRAFLPLLTASRGAIVNNLSLNAFAPLPLIPAYSVSKAAAFSMTQSLRALLAGRGVRVHAVLTGPTDTDMSRGLDVPKASAESVARAIFDGVETGEEDIFPDPMSESMAESWRTGETKAFERQLSAFAAAEPVKS